MVAECTTHDTEINAAQHPATLPDCLSPSVRISGRLIAMNSDAAELSSITTVVSDTARRVAEVAERRASDPDDPVINRLYEIERALITAERRLRDASRALG